MLGLAPGKRARVQQDERAAVHVEPAELASFIGRYQGGRCGAELLKSPGSRVP